MTPDSIWTKNFLKHQGYDLDSIAVIFDGKIAQVATPQMLYGMPSSRRVGNFIGMMNFLEAKILGTSGETVEVDVQSLGTLTLPLSQAPGGVEGCHSIGIRPEMWTILAGGQTAERELEGVCAPVCVRAHARSCDRLCARAHVCVCARGGVRVRCE